MKKLTTLLVGALAALLLVAPVAGAKAQRHRTVRVCGIVDAASTLPTTLVIGTGGTKQVTIQNSKPVTVPANVVAGADVCARAKIVRTGATKTKVLLNVKVRPAATVVATGAVTLGTGMITVATLDFIFKPGFTLSPRITDGKTVRAWGSAATAGGDLMLKRVHRVVVGHSRVKHPKGARPAKPASAIITGRVSDLTPATATTAGSATVGGIILVVPAGKVLRPRVANGARVTAWAVVKDGALTLRRVVVTQRAVA
jgi:hypothetical protein